MCVRVYSCMYTSILTCTRSPVYACLFLYACVYVCAYVVYICTPICVLFFFIWFSTFAFLYSVWVILRYVKSFVVINFVGYYLFILWLYFSGRLYLILVWIDVRCGSFCLWWHCVPCCIFFLFLFVFTWQKILFKCLQFLIISFFLINKYLFFKCKDC